jgi:hypothetical protein
MKARGGAGSETGRPPTPCCKSHHESLVPIFIGRYHRLSADEGGPSVSSLLSGVNWTESAKKWVSALECPLLGYSVAKLYGRR